MREELATWLLGLSPVAVVGSALAVGVLLTAAVMTGAAWVRRLVFRYENYPSSARRVVRTAVLEGHAPPRSARWVLDAVAGVLEPIARVHGPVEVTASTVIGRWEALGGWEGRRTRSLVRVEVAVAGSVTTLTGYRDLGFATLIDPLTGELLRVRLTRDATNEGGERLHPREEWEHVRTRVREAVLAAARAGSHERLRGEEVLLVERTLDALPRDVAETLVADRRVLGDRVAALGLVDDVASGVPLEWALRRAEGAAR